MTKRIADLTTKERRRLTEKRALKQLALLTDCDERTIRRAIMQDSRPAAASVRVIEQAIPAVLDALGAADGA